MGKSHYIIPIFVPNEGCPHNCVFCDQSTITGNHEKVDRTFTQNTIETYLKTLPKNDAVIEVSFFGGTFTAIPMERQCELLEVASHYKKSGKIKYIHLSTRPDYINKDILDNLKRYGVDVIELGVQSMDTEVLKRSGRGHSDIDVINASNLIKTYGFTLGHQVMPGLPSDNFEKDIITVRRLIELKPNIFRIYPSLVIKNTPMEKMYLNGTYKPYSLYDAVYISKILYGMLISNNINVIRIGLQPTKEINDKKDVVAGPFHPAFRELVEGSIYNDIIKDIIPDGYIGNVNILINPKDISKLYADKKKFFNDMKKQLNTINFTVKQDKNIRQGDIYLNSDTFCEEQSIYSYMLKKYKEGYMDIL